MFAYRCQLCSELFLTKKPDPLAPPSPHVRKEAELTKVDARQDVRLATRLPITFLVSKIKKDGVITELALGGCTLEAEVVLAIGAKLRLEIRIAENEPPLVIHQAFVRSIRPTGYGIQFMEILDAEKERLGRVLEKLLAALLG
jgi:hypothetical protein